MTPETVMDVARLAIETTMLVAGPMLILSLVIGLLVGEQKLLDVLLELLRIADLQSIRPNRSEESSAEEMAIPLSVCLEERLLDHSVLALVEDLPLLGEHPLHEEGVDTYLSFIEFDACLHFLEYIGNRAIRRVYVGQERAVQNLLNGLYARSGCVLSDLKGDVAK